MNLLQIYAGFSGLSLAEVAKKHEGSGYGEFKVDLAELVVGSIMKLQVNYQQYRSDEANLHKVIEEGSQKASHIANAKLVEIKTKIGLL